MRFYVLTLFPEMIEAALFHSVIKKAIERQVIQIECVNIRDFAGNKHNSVDDYPYGGGAGMVIRAQPVYDAYESIRRDVSPTCRVVYMTPQGETFSQRKADDFSQMEDLILICGHYEGIDQRVIDEIVTDEISVGDYVLTGGELAAAVVIDATARLVEGVLGKAESSVNDSFSSGMLEHAQYTRPPEFMGRCVPQVLLSGDHGEIAKWRHEESVRRTMERRPDLARNAERFANEKLNMKNEG